MLLAHELKIFLREPTANDEALSQIVDLVNGLVDEMGPYPSTFGGEPVTVRLVRLNAAARAWRNPEGATSRTETIDDWSETKRFDRSQPLGGVYLTDAERRDLRAAAAGGVQVEDSPWAGSMPYRR